ncbi:MAG: hypothetical protein COU90_02820 [Candidatus Ryanbacteria bacterium CG10_big_fil_rev_8_21_14_0_10_43_42]|uniref:Uncharacterized protein n=1 Tax=Candidatus Ryanbacteria bacterium CG10_big_fil_rev_8_21_14_0_10_43_42 TaxID=1974864 RepID=A0A2M8KWR8_9BACT|nr:MAG: hypothetical protein COU90_02820 [Candidatus Ryanbacteria bacterium CG10_big_fil_rev_8_21_14_0_10_43_42]
MQGVFVMITYIPKRALDEALSREGEDPPTQEEALSFLRKVMSFREIPSILNNPPLIGRLLDTFYGRHARAGNAFERMSIVERVRGEKLEITGKRVREKNKKKEIQRRV